MVHIAGPAMIGVLGQDLSELKSRSDSGAGYCAPSEAKAREFVTPYIKAALSSQRTPSDDRYVGEFCRCSVASIAVPILGPAALAWYRVRSKRDKCFLAVGLEKGQGARKCAAANAVEDALVEAVLEEVIEEALTDLVPFFGGAICIARLESMYAKIVDAVADVAVTLYAAWVIDKLA